MQNVCSCLFSGSAQPQPLLQIFLIQITLARSLVNIHAPGLSLWDLLQSLWNSKKGKSHLTLEMFWVGTLPLWRLVRIVVALAPGPTSGAVGQNVDAWDILWNNNNIFSKFCQASILLQLLFLPPVLSVQGRKIRHRPPFHPLLPLYWLEKEFQKTLIQDLSAAVKPSEEVLQSVESSKMVQASFFTWLWGSHSWHLQPSPPAAWLPLCKQMLLKDSYVLYLERRILTPSGTSSPPTKLSNNSSASSSL